MEQNQLWVLDFGNKNKEKTRRDIFFLDKSFFLVFLSFLDLSFF